jgi:hypothetical protein
MVYKVQKHHQLLEQVEAYQTDLQNVWILPVVRFT